MFACFGRDVVHPGPRGHNLMGAMAARHIARRLLREMCVESRTSSLVMGLKTDIQTAPSTLRTSCWRPRPRMSLNRTDLSRLEALEVNCWEVGTSGLPIREMHPEGSWQVVDIGHSGVFKPRLASTRVGDMLRLRLSTSQDFTLVCTTVQIELGYHVSLSQRNLGGLYLNCSGDCFCLRTPATFPDLAPFPEIQEWAPYNHDSTLLGNAQLRLVNGSWVWNTNGSLSVTATTTFDAYLGAQSSDGKFASFVSGVQPVFECSLDIHHVAQRDLSGRASPWHHKGLPRLQSLPRESVVMIDTLTVEQLSQACRVQHEQQLWERVKRKLHSNDVHRVAKWAQRCNATSQAPRDFGWLLNSNRHAKCNVSSSSPL